MSESLSSSPRKSLGDLEPDALMKLGFEDPASFPSVPGFEIKKLIGRGGMGLVYLARHIELDREVAVKLVAVEKHSDSSFLERLEREARIMAKLKHPHIVTIYHFERLEEGKAAIVMEYVEGGTLRDQIAKHPQGIPLESAHKWACEIISALAAAHASKVVHRDIKPENILIDQNHSAQITDFGIALPFELTKAARLTFTGTTVGTLDYLAPERFQSEEPDVRSDIYAVGVILYEMLTGKVPRGSFEPPGKLLPGIPPSLSRATTQALRPNADERFSSMEDFLAAIDKKSQLTRRHWLAIASGACGVVAASILLKRKLFPEEVPSQKTLVPGEWKNSLNEVKLPEDVISGNWKREEYLGTDDSICILALEQEMPASYDVKISFVPMGKLHSSLAIFFPANGSIGSVDIGDFGRGRGGVQTLDGVGLGRLKNFEIWLRKKQHYELKIEVRAEHVRLFLNNEEKGLFFIKNRVLGIPEPWAWDPMKKPAALAMGTHGSPTLFKSIEWRNA